MKKISIHSAVAERIQYVVEGQQKYPNNIKAQNKEKKLIQIRYNNERECSEFEASPNTIRSLKFDASNSKYGASQPGLSAVIRFFIPYKL